jgi:hypothetical protein
MIILVIGRDAHIAAGSGLKQNYLLTQMGMNAVRMNAQNAVRKISFRAVSNQRQTRIFTEGNL